MGSLEAELAKLVLLVDETCEATTSLATDIRSYQKIAGPLLIGDVSANANNKVDDQQLVECVFNLQEVLNSTKAELQKCENEKMSVIEENDILIAERDHRLTMESSSNHSLMSVDQDGPGSFAPGVSTPRSPPALVRSTQQPIFPPTSSHPFRPCDRG